LSGHYQYVPGFLLIISMSLDFSMSLNFLSSLDFLIPTKPRDGEYAAHEGYRSSLLGIGAHATYNRLIKTLRK